MKIGSKFPKEYTHKYIPINEYTSNDCLVEGTKVLFFLDKATKKNIVITTHYSKEVLGTFEVDDCSKSIASPYCYYVYMHLLPESVRKQIINAKKQCAETIKKNRKMKPKSFAHWADYSCRAENWSLLQRYVGCGSTSIKAQDKENKLKEFNKDLIKLPLAKGKVYYRGLSVYKADSYKKTKEYAFNKKKGSILPVMSLTSISRCPRQALGFMGSNGILLKIETKQARMSYNVSEKEAFLLRGSKLLIKDIRKGVSIKDYLGIKKYSSCYADTFDEYTLTDPD